MTGTKNITRYTYVKAAFQGWRVCIIRKGNQFIRYFSDKAFGSEEASFAAALDVRDRVLAELQDAPGNAEAVFARYRCPAATEGNKGCTPPHGMVHP